MNQKYNQVEPVQELLLILAEAEEDVINNRTSPIQDTFDNIRKSILNSKEEYGKY